MTANAIPKIDSPGQGCGHAIRVVGQTREKATNAADCDPDGNRQGEQVAGPSLDPGLSLDPLNSGRSAEEAAHNGLTGHEESQVEGVAQCEPGVFNPIKRPASNCRAANSGEDYRETVRCRKKISSLVFEAAV